MRTSSIQQAAYAALPCLRCDILEERIEALTALLRAVHRSGPAGDLCRSGDGCTTDIKWVTHPKTCLTQRVIRAIGGDD